MTKHLEELTLRRKRLSTKDTSLWQGFYPYRFKGIYIMKCLLAIKN